MTKCCVKILAQLVNSLRALVDDFLVTAIKANQLNLETAMCFPQLLLMCMRVRRITYLLSASQRYRETLKGNK